MAGWVEPPCIQPSTKEYNPNINAYGTMMAMAPLGTMPTAKQKKAAQAMLEDYLNPGKKTSKAKPRTSVDRSSPAFARESSAPIATIEEEMLPLDTREEIGDGDYAPKASGKETKHHKVTQPVSTRDTPVLAREQTSTSLSAVSATSAMTPSVSPEKQDSESARLEELVDNAVKWALHNGRYPTAYALRTLFDEFRTPQNTRITDLFHAVYSETASSKQVDEFQQLMTYKKREGQKKDVYPTRARAYFANEIAAIQEHLAAVAALSPLENPAPTFQEESSAAILTPLQPSISAHQLASSTPIIGEVGVAPVGPPLSPSRKAWVDRISRFGTFASTNNDNKETSYKSPFAPIPGQTVTNGVSFGPQNSRPTSVVPDVPSTKPSAEEDPADQADLHKRATSVSSSTSSALSSVNEDILQDYERGHTDDQIKRELTYSHSPYPSTNMIFSDPVYQESRANHATRPLPEHNLTTTSSINNFRSTIPSKSRGPHWGVFNSAKDANLNPLDSTSSTPIPTLSNWVERSGSTLPSGRPSYFAPQESNNHIKSHQTTLKFRKPLEKSEPVVLQPVYTEEMAQRKRKAFDTTEASIQTQSDIRPHRKRPKHVASDDARDTEVIMDSPPSPPLPTLQETTDKYKLRLKSVRPAVATKVEPELMSSPVVPSFQEYLALPSSPPTSRASTPRMDGRPSRSVKVTGPRMKLSPVKSRTSNVLRASPRAGAERNSPMPVNHGQDDNDDFCSSCNGIGDLVCCDGCTRSFHLKCVDPKDGGELPETWFCQVCTAARGPPIEEGTGIWAKLIALNTRSNPKAFFLPKDIREYFEGVATGKNGEYEDATVATVVSKAKNRAGYDEVPDWSKLKDSKGKYMICYNCRQGPVRDPSSGTNPLAGSAAATRQLIPCNVCPHSWHLDCLDPPMAVPPAMKRGWKCPLHVDDILIDIPAALAPAHRFRKIKNSKPVIPINPKNTKNNGYIEVELEPSEDENDGTYLKVEFGRTYRLPEKGIKLDFMNKCRGLPEPEPTYGIESSVQQRNAAHSSLEEIQAALNLSHFATQLSAQEEGIPGIIRTLLSEAPPAVVSMIALGDATELATADKDTTTPTKAKKMPMSQAQRQSLQAMKALIDAQLAEGGAIDGGELIVASAEKTKEDEEIL